MSDCCQLRRRREREALQKNIAARCSTGPRQRQDRREKTIPSAAPRPAWRSAIDGPHALKEDPLGRLSRVSDSGPRRRRRWREVLLLLLHPAQRLADCAVHVALECLMFFNNYTTCRAARPSAPAPAPAGSPEDAAPRPSACTQQLLAANEDSRHCKPTRLTSTLA